MSPIRSRHRLLAVVFSVAAPLAFAVPAARADAPAGPMAGDPEELSAFSSFDLALSDASLPPGWKLLEGEAAGADAKALSDAVTAIAKDKGVAESEKFHVEMRSAAAEDGAKAHFALYDLGEPSATFVDALKAEAAKKGWVVREMGTARHGLVTAAPEALREKAVAAAVACASKLLTAGALGALEVGDGEKAIGRARIALAIDPKSAGANYIVGLAIKQFVLGRRQPVEGLDPAIRHFRASLDKGATHPLAVRETVLAKGNLGQTILNKGGPSEEARTWIKEAVAGIAEIPYDFGIGLRYDLACAHGRLKELDDAFKLLTAVLEDVRKEPVEGIEDLWRKDPDFDNLKADERWKKLLEKFPEAGGEMK